MSRRDEERRRFRREARQTFGGGPRLAAVDHSAPIGTTDAPLGSEIREAQRLAAVHDPTKPSACRLCGRTVLPAEAWQEVAAWKCCPPCAALVPGGLAAVMTCLLDVPQAVTRDEAHDLCTRLGIDNPSYFVGRWPTDPGHPEPWAHVSSTLRERGRALLTHMRSAASNRPRPSEHGVACGWCGVNRSTAWTASPWHYAGRRGLRAPLCAACLPWALRSGALSGGSGETHWREHAFAAAVDLVRPSWGIHYDMRVYWEADLGTAGTTERWAYLGETRARLRGAVIRGHPRLVRLTPQEARVLRLEREVAAAEANRQSVPLSAL